MGIGAAMIQHQQRQQLQRQQQQQQQQQPVRITSGHLGQNVATSGSLVPSSGERKTPLRSRAIPHHIKRRSESAIDKWRLNQVDRGLHLGRGLSPFYTVYMNSIFHSFPNHYRFISSICPLVGWLLHDAFVRTKINQYFLPCKGHMNSKLLRFQL